MDEDDEEPAEKIPTAERRLRRLGQLQDHDAHRTDTRERSRYLNRKLAERTGGQHDH